MNNQEPETAAAIRDDTRTMLLATGEALADATKRITALTAENERLRISLRKAVHWFDEYASQHEAKARQAVDSYEQSSRRDKAKRNSERAKELFAVLKGDLANG